MKHNLKVKHGKNLDQNINYFLEQLNYEGVAIFKDPPEAYFANHYHSENEYIYILEGSMSIELNHKIIELKEGDEFILPSKLNHNVRMGLMGCKYLVAVSNGNFNSIFSK